MHLSPRRSVMVLVMLFAACSRGSHSSPNAVVGVGQTRILIGAGDIAACGSRNAEFTARVLDTVPGIVFTVGDHAYPFGTLQQFTDCYAPTWGRHRARTRPAPGNHDYHLAGAAPYFAYFGESAGPVGRGYYSYDLEDWHIVSLNSNIARPMQALLRSNGFVQIWLRTARCARPPTGIIPCSARAHMAVIYTCATSGVCYRNSARSSS